MEEVLRNEGCESCDACDAVQTDGQLFAAMAREGTQVLRRNVFEKLRDVIFKRFNLFRERTMNKSDHSLYKQNKTCSDQIRLKPSASLCWFPRTGYCIMSSHVCGYRVFFLADLISFAKKVHCSLLLSNQAPSSIAKGQSMLLPFLLYTCSETNIVAWGQSFLLIPPVCEIEMA